MVREVVEEMAEHEVPGPHAQRVAPRIVVHAMVQRGQVKRVRPLLRVHAPARHLLTPEGSHQVSPYVLLCLYMTCSVCLNIADVGSYGA